LSRKLKNKTYRRCSYQSVAEKLMFSILYAMSLT